MNRMDEIQCLARDIATNIHADPAKRDAMADDLIRLCTAIVAAVGKSTAMYGEGEMNDACCNDPECGDSCGTQFDQAKYHGIYMAGEQMQTGARWVETEAVNPAVNIRRYSEPTSWDWCACGHGPGVHSEAGCTGEQHNREACKGGPCPGFRVVQAPPVWTHVDRRPAYFRDMDERGVMFIPPAVQVPLDFAYGLDGSLQAPGACGSCGSTNPFHCTPKDGS